MKTFLRNYFTTTLSLFIATAAFAQIPVAPVWDNIPTASDCLGGTGGHPLSAVSCPAETFSGNFTDGQPFPNQPSDLDAGSVWRFLNINGAATEAKQINATVVIDDIYRGILTELDDDGAVDQSNNSLINFLAPNFKPDVSLGSGNRNGYAQLTINFYQTDNDGNRSITDAGDFAILANLSKIKYSHIDIDGVSGYDGYTDNYWFRETGLVKVPATGSVNVTGSVDTELQGYSYVNGLDHSTGFVGSICNRDNTSRLREVAASFEYPDAISSITIRIGYDYNVSPAGNRTLGNIAARLYATTFQCIFDDRIVLPVKLVHFDAIEKDGESVFTWQTAMERNNKGFSLEKNISGNWTEVAWVNSKAQQGNSSSLLDYSYSQKGTETSVTQYRLRQVDFDGKNSFSAIRVLRGNQAGAETILFPNPGTGGHVQLLYKKRNVNLLINVLDASGRSVKKVSGNSDAVIAIENLAPGQYVAIIQEKESGRTSSKKFVISK